MMRPPHPTTGRLLMLALVVSALCVLGVGGLRRLDVDPGPLLAWARPPNDEVVELLVDAKVRTGRVRPIWVEINLWKLYLLFGVHRGDLTQPLGRGWLRHHLPWVRYARVTAVLGGNYAPAVARWCDRGVAVPEHPYTGGECGHDGTPGPAAVNELVRDGAGGSTIDYGPFRTAVERLLASGVRPHLNISAAPAAFTGGVGDFTHYHWNAAPVQNLAAWRDFVAGAFTAVADLDPTGWRVSIVNEPNCLTLVGWDRQVLHVGYAGAPVEYARTFAVTAAAVRDAAPGVRLHAGNYVTSATFPGENNVATYLAALHAALAADGNVRWDDVSAVSASLYETQETSLYEFVPIRLQRLQDALAAGGLDARPLKVDELEVHPSISAPFDASQTQRLDTTLYAASWHAEALRAFVDAGNVVSVAPWLDRMVAIPSLAPYPKAHVYGLFGVLAGQLDAVETDAGLRFEPTVHDHGLRRLAVAGEALPPPDAARLHRERASSVRALATRTPAGLRVLVVHHQNRPVTDGARIRRRMGREVRVIADGLVSGAYVVRHTGIADAADGAHFDGSASTPLRWHDDGCRVARGGVVEIMPRHRIAANTVWLFEATRHPRCPSERAARPAE